MDAVPFVGQWKRTFQNEANTKGVVPAVAGLLTDGFAPEAAGKVVSVARNLPSTMKGAIQGPITKPISTLSEAPISPLQRYNAAKHLGVNLDAAYATNRAVIKQVKCCNQDSHSIDGASQELTSKDMGRL